MSIYPHALDALRRGWSVIPVNRHKVPLVPWKRFQRELPDEALLREWFERQPNKGLGLVTGALSGRFVVETDSEAAYEYLLARELPPGPIVQSSAPYKRHFHFRHPATTRPGLLVANSTGKLFPGLDVRGDGGYVVLPPSLHKSGVHYQWIVAPDDVELPDAPDWILDAVSIRGQKPEAGGQSWATGTAEAASSYPTQTGDDSKYLIANASPANPSGRPLGLDGWPKGSQTGTSVPGQPTPNPTNSFLPPASNLLPLPYVRAAFEDELTRVRCALDGQKHAQLFKSVASIAEFIPGGYLDALEVEQRFYEAIASRARDPDAAGRTIRDAIARGQQTPRHPPSSSSMNPPLLLLGGAAHRDDSSPSDDQTSTPDSPAPSPESALPESAPADETGMYAVEDGRTVFRVMKVVGRGGDKREIEEYAPIADLVASITREYRHEEGRTSFGIEGITRNGRSFQVEIDGEKLADAKQVAALLSNVTDANCVFYPRRAEHLAAAIKAFSKPQQIEVIRRFNRTGWTQRGEFLIPGLEPPDVQLRLDKELAYRAIPPGQKSEGTNEQGREVPTSTFSNASSTNPVREDGQPKATQTGTSVPGLGGRNHPTNQPTPNPSHQPTTAQPPTTETKPIAELLDHLLRAHIDTVTPIALAHVLLAPLSRLARWQDEKFALFLNGRSGALKTSWAQMALCVYGHFGSDDTLLRFGMGGTVNALMSFPAHAADLPLLIDNFKPGTGNGQREATTLIHGLMEGTEKKRLNRDGTRRESREFRCWMLFTGEDTVGDAAAIARMLVVNAHWELDKPNPVLYDLQNYSHQLPRLGGSWISWLQSGQASPYIEEARSHLRERREQWARYLRRQNKEMVNALRISTSLALCQCVWEIALHHAPFTPTLEKWSGAFERSLNLCAQSMAGVSAQSHEANRYLATLRGLVISQKAYLQETTRDPNPEDRRTFLGWQDADFVYLLPEVAFTAALEALKHQNGLNGLSQGAISRQLDQLGLLAKKDGSNYAVKKTLGNGAMSTLNPRVLHLRRDKFYDEC